MKKDYLSAPSLDTSVFAGEVPAATSKGDALQHKGELLHLFLLLHPLRYIGKPGANRNVKFEVV